MASHTWCTIMHMCDLVRNAVRQHGHVARCSSRLLLLWIHHFSDHRRFASASVHVWWLTASYFSSQLRQLPIALSVFCCSRSCVLYTSTLSLLQLLISVSQSWNSGPHCWQLLISLQNANLIVINIAWQQHLSTLCISFCCPMLCLGAAFAIATWLSVTSVSFMYCAQTTELIILRLSPDCSPAILVFQQNMNPIARGDPPHWGCQMGEG